MLSAYMDGFEGVRDPWTEISDSQCVQTMERYCPEVEDISDAEPELPVASFDLGFSVENIDNIGDSQPKQLSTIEQNCEHLVSKSTCQLAKRVHDDSSGFGSGCSLSKCPKTIVVKPRVKPARVYKDPVSEQELDKLSHKSFADDTHRKLRWAVNMYEEWRVQQNKNPDLNMITASLFNVGTLNKANLSYGLCRFLSEVTKVNGEDFPGKTLYEILISIQIYLKMKGLHWKLVDDQDFVNVKFTLDNLMKQRTREGLGQHVRKARVLSYEQEEHLWETSVLGCSSPEQLMNTVLFLFEFFFIEMGLDMWSTKKMQASKPTKEVCTIGNWIARRSSFL